jgi:Spy/CpxP family protein refolding chaperone
MKKKLLFTITILAGFILITANSFAQDENQEPKKEGKELFEKFKLKRKEFISKAMNLTESEKNAFFPLCNELQMKKYELNKKLRESIRKILKAQKNNQAVTEEDYKKVIELSIQVKQKELKLEEEYIDKFLKVISPEKVFLYQRAEQQFGRSMATSPRKHRN